MDGYSNAVTLGYNLRQYVAVFGEASSHARHDDLVTDFRAWQGRNFLILRKSEPNPEDYRRYFRRSATDSFEIRGARFWRVRGEGFDYAAYREGVLAGVRRKYYAIPTWLPQRACYMCDRYFPGNMPPLIRLLRPHQWLKNGFVFLGLLFGHAWTDPVKLGQALWAFAAFSLLASAVYVMNDLVDREQDRLHPKKKSGRWPPVRSAGAAKALAALCLLGGGAIAWVPGRLGALDLLAYVLLNVAYSFGLKHVVILDVFIIASGFMLRILAGTLGLGIAPSQWLLLCGLMLTLFLGFAKRRAELSRCWPTARAIAACWNTTRRRCSTSSSASPRLAR
jgi:hypothetical protein